MGWRDSTTRWSRACRIQCAVGRHICEKTRWSVSDAISSTGLRDFSFKDVTCTKTALRVLDDKMVATFLSVKDDGLLTEFHTHLNCKGILWSSSYKDFRLYLLFFYGFTGYFKSTMILTLTASVEYKSWFLNATCVFTSAKSSNAQNPIEWYPLPNGKVLKLQTTSSTKAELISAVHGTSTTWLYYC